MGDLANVYGYIIAAFLGLLGAAILFLILTGKIDLSQLISEPSGEASMSRFQFLIFTFVIAFSLLFVIARKGDFPSQIPDAIWGLLGISGGSYVISKGIQTSRDTTLAGLPQGPHPPAAGQPTAQPQPQPQAGQPPQTHVEP
jgi:glycerol uptake facilitator-like aquaporin